ncbi:hypothetical protein [Waterburya agarophytonicola]|nr:hypothetical protein [Waterburya agarophytonicola]
MSHNYQSAQRCGFEFSQLECNILEILIIVPTSTDLDARILTLSF